jgi:coenzyme F420-reducing hydrogenase beta subunit
MVCPQLNYESESVDSPLAYALKAPQPVLSESSSGGAFSLLADFILEKGGFVCGVVFDGEFNAVYELTDDREEIAKMRGSKYVYSEMRDIYDRISEKLKAGSDVLFVGLPCQVKAVRNCIGNDEHLYCVDLICGGQPSKGVFQRYVSEISSEKPISGLSFRKKGYPYGMLAIDYADGTSKLSFGDKYYAGYNRHMIKNQACGDCKFSSAPRPGDLTIGDLWGAERYIRDTDISEGVSAVLVNTRKGREMFDAISEKAAYKREVPLDFVKRFNRMGPRLAIHESRKRLFDLVARGYPVSKSVDYCLVGRFDMGITGFWRVNDYGGELSYYALFMFFMDRGMESLMIESRNDIAGLPSEPALFSNHYTANSRAKWYPNIREQSEIGARVDNAIAGPGPIWDRRIIGQDVVECYSLDFIPSWRNKISIASSFGSNVFEGTDEDRARIANAIGRLDKVSVCDLSSRSICESMGVEAKIIMDPVFLCDPRHYRDLIAKSKASFPHGYVLIYALHQKDLEGFEAAVDELGLGQIFVGNAETNFNLKSPYPVTNTYSIENWLKCIDESSFVITDSYYAAAVAILFRKPFAIVTKAEPEREGRISSLLKIAGLEGRIFVDIPELLNSGAIGEEIDYDAVHERIALGRDESIEWVLSSLQLS